MGITALLAAAAPWIIKDTLSAYGEVVTHGDRSKPQVVLTFDDGFLPREVERVVNIASLYNLHFTFFPVGWRVLDRYPNLWRDVYLAGHEIENHSHSHRILNSRLVKPEEMVYDISLHQQVLNEILGEPYQERFFRPPGGYLEPAEIEAANSLDLTVVKWSLSSGGTGRLSTPDSSLANVVKATNGDIVLLHCIPNDTRRLTGMIETLQQKGLDLVTLSQFLDVA